MLCEKKGLFSPLGNMWEVEFPPESWASGEERCVFVLCMKAVSVQGAPSWQVAFLAPGMGHTGGLSADHLLLLVEHRKRFSNGCLSCIVVSVVYACMMRIPTPGILNSAFSEKIKCSCSYVLKLFQNVQAQMTFLESRIYINCSVSYSK